MKLFARILLALLAATLAPAAFAQSLPSPHFQTETLNATPTWPTQAAGSWCVPGPASATPLWCTPAQTPILAANNTWTGTQNFTNSTASSSPTTGAMIVNGGVGIGGSLNVGGYPSTIYAGLNIGGASTTAWPQLTFNTYYNGGPTSYMTPNVGFGSAIEQSQSDGSLTFYNSGPTPTTAAGQNWPVFNTTLRMYTNGHLQIFAYGATPGALVSDSSGNITSGTLAVANGGTGTATPGLVAGSGVTVTGTWPNQTVTATTAAAGSVGVRQTVISGPANSGGNPTFWPATSASLTLAFQNVSSGTPLVVSAAQGFTSAGATNDVTAAYSSMASVTVGASATSYVFWNTSTNAADVQTLAPIYQWGGAASVTNGQYTFVISSRTMFKGNGTVATATPAVCLGQVVSGASSITSTTAYAYDGVSTATFAGTNVPTASGGSYAPTMAPIGVPSSLVHENGWVTATVANAGLVVGQSADIRSLTNTYGGPVIDILTSPIGAASIYGAGGLSYFLSADWTAADNNATVTATRAF